MSREKIVIGMPTYSIGFTLKNKNRYSVGDPVTNPSKPLKHTRALGRAAYYEASCRVNNNNHIQYYNYCSFDDDVNDDDNDDVDENNYNC